MKSFKTTITPWHSTNVTESQQGMTPLNNFWKIPINGCTTAVSFLNCFLWKDKAQISKRLLIPIHRSTWHRNDCEMSSILQSHKKESQSKERCLKNDCWLHEANFPSLLVLRLFWLDPPTATLLFFPSTAAVASPVYLGRLPPPQAPPTLTQRPSQ